MIVIFYSSKSMRIFLIDLINKSMNTNIYVDFLYKNDLSHNLPDFNLMNFSL